MQDGAVVAAAEGFAYGAQRKLCQLPREEHRYLARKGDVLGTPFARHVRHAQVKVLGDPFLDQFDGNGLATLLVQEFPKQSLDGLNVEPRARESRKRSDPDECAFEPPDIAADASGQER